MNPLLVGFNVFGPFVVFDGNRIYFPDNEIIEIYVSQNEFYAARKCAFLIYYEVSQELLNWAQNPLQTNRPAIRRVNSLTEKIKILLPYSSLLFMPKQITADHAGMDTRLVETSDDEGFNCLTQK